MGILEEEFSVAFGMLMDINRVNAAPLRKCREDFFHRGWPRVPRYLPTYKPYSVLDACVPRYLLRICTYDGCDEPSTYLPHSWRGRNVYFVSTTLPQSPLVQQPAKGLAIPGGRLDSASRRLLQLFLLRFTGVFFSFSVPHDDKLSVARNHLSSHWFVSPLLFRPEVYLHCTVQHLARKSPSCASWNTDHPQRHRYVTHPVMPAVA